MRGNAARKDAGGWPARWCLNQTGLAGALEWRTADEQHPVDLSARSCGWSGSGADSHSCRRPSGHTPKLRSRRSPAPPHLNRARTPPLKGSRRPRGAGPRAHHPAPPLDQWL